MAEKKTEEKVPTETYEIGFNTHGFRPALAGDLVEAVPAAAARINAKLAAQGQPPLYVAPGTAKAKADLAKAKADLEAGEAPKPKRRRTRKKAAQAASPSPSPNPKPEDSK